MKKPVIIGGLVFISLLILTQYLSYQRYLLLSDTAEKELTSKANQVKEGLQTVMQHSYSVTQALAFIVEKYGPPGDFDSVADLLLKANQHIDAIELTKGGVITHVYPLKGNESVIGFDILLDSARKSGAVTTIDKRSFFVSGPINLKQGGQGFVSRVPIFKNNEFWGFAAVIVSISTLLNAANIDTSANGFFSYQLAKINAATGEEDIFLSTSDFSKSKKMLPVAFPSGEWKLYIASEKDNIFYSVLIFVMLGLALSFTGGMLAWFIAAQPARLNKLVDEKMRLLQTSERRYQTLTEISPVGVFHTDEAGLTTYVNPAWCRISGLSFEKAIGNGGMEVVYESDRKLLAKNWSEAIERQSISLTEYRFVRPDGSIRWVLGQAVPQKSPEDEIIGYVGTITDITDRKKAEEDLRFNEQQLHLIYDSVTDPIFLLDVKDNDRFTFISVNKAFLETTGLPEEQILGKEIKDILPASSLDGTIEKYKEAIESKKSVEWEDVSEYPSGIKAGILKITPVFNKEGNCTRIVGTIHDVTEQKKYEAMLLSEKNFSESIINSLPGVLYLYDENGKFIKWNKNFEKVSGYTGEEIANMHPLEFFDADEKQLLESRIKEVFVTGTGEVESNFLTKTKKKIPYYFNGRRISLDNKICLIGMGIDISELRNARDELVNRERKFRSTLDQMLEGVQIYDFDWNCLYINDAAVGQGQVPKETVLSKNLTECYPGIEHTELFSIYEACKNDKKPRHIEYEFTFPDMTKKWFELSIQTTPDGVFILSMDISDRKKAEQEVQQVTEQLRRLTVHQQTALEEERKRISREIHDELGQQLTAIKMDIAWIDKKGADQSSFIKSKLKNVITLLDLSNQSIRKILTELRMGVLDHHDLEEGLESHGRQFTNITGIPLHFTANKRGINAGEAVAACIFRVFQEALTNITKYAEAKTVTSSLVQDEDFVTLQIEDDGKGFDPEAINNKHSFGILGMKERVASLKGTLRISSQPGKGTSITVRIPYKL